MAWCPKCESEYVEGVEVCVDCGCSLVEVLPDAAEGKEKEKTADESITKEMFFEMGEELVKRMNAEENKEVEEEKEEKENKVYSYRDNEERAQENRSSAYVLLGVGVVGCVIVALLFLDKLPIAMNPFNRYMTSGVMGVMFVIFVIMGFVSMKSSKVFEKKAKTEGMLTVEIKDWCAKALAADKIDGEIFSEEEMHNLAEEIKYFKRFDEIKRLINYQFLNLDEAYLEHMIDEIYPEIFSEI